MMPTMTDNAMQPIIILEKKLCADVKFIFKHSTVNIMAFLTLPDFHSIFPNFPDWRKFSKISLIGGTLIKEDFAFAQCEWAPKDVVQIRLDCRGTPYLDSPLALEMSSPQL